MDINQLKSFLEVAKTRHFGRAGENLFVTQAAISSRIRQLEEELGVRLFSRSRNNIQLTPEGQRFLPYAENLLLTWSRACQEVELPRALSEQISIAATPGLCHYLLQHRVSAIQAEQPLLSLRLQAQSATELATQLRDGIHDLVVIYDPPSLPELVAVPLGKLKLSLVASYPVSNASEALKQHYVYVDWGSSFEVFHQRKYGDLPAASLYTNLGSFAENYLLENDSAAYLPEQVCHHQRINKVPRAATFSRKLYAVFQGNSEKESLIKSVIGQLGL